MELRTHHRFMREEMEAQDFADFLQVHSKAVVERRPLTLIQPLASPNRCEDLLSGRETIFPSYRRAENNLRKAVAPYRAVANVTSSPAA